MGELIFTYTTSSCYEGFETCTDDSTPTSVALIVITGATHGAELFRCVVSIGDTITFGNLEDCLPDSVSVSVTSSDGSTPQQSSTVDTSCDGRGLFLLNPYGALNFVIVRSKTITKTENVPRQCTYGSIGSES